MKADESVAPLRVLMLHGYRQNSMMFRQKSGAFRKALKKYIEPIFLDAPLESGDTPDSRGWWYSDSERRHFSATESCCDCPGFAASVESVREAVRRHAPIDGLLGFSQGAALAALLCALQTSQEQQFGFRFVLLVSAFRSRAESHARLYRTASITVPSLHVLGESDAVIDREMSEQLAGDFVSARVVRHPGGHYVPMSGDIKTECINFLLQFSRKSCHTDETLDEENATIATHQHTIHNGNDVLS